MKLNYQKQKTEQGMPGIQAALLRDDVNGSSLILQGGHSVLSIKLADLLSFIEEQDKQEQEAASADKT